MVRPGLASVFIPIACLLFAATPILVLSALAMTFEPALFHKAATLLGISHTATAAVEHSLEHSQPVPATRHWFEGNWYSADFYGSHGKETVALAPHSEGDALLPLFCHLLMFFFSLQGIVATKVTGDPYVPAGMVSWKTTLTPMLERGESVVPAKLQIRKDPNINFFEWVDAEVLVQNGEHIQVAHRFAGALYVGNFYREERAEV